MKVGLISGEFPPMEGGVGAFTRELAQGLHHLGHQVHIITDKQARPADFPRRVQRLFQPIDVGYAQLHPHIRHWRWSSVSDIVDIVVRHELDVVNIQYQAAAYNMRSPAINLLPWRLKNVCRVVVTFHDLRVPYLFPKAGRLRKMAVRFMAQQAHGAITTNPDDMLRLQQQIGKPVAQIPIGSNIKAYRPNHIEIDEVRDKLHLSPKNCLLGYFGFLNESKGADKLIKSLVQLDERFHLVFIGGQTGASDTANNAAFLASLENLIAKHDLTERVHWTGFLSDQRVSAHLHAVDVMVMPYRDGSSLRRGTLMAALAHGRPLITTWPTVPTPELVHQQNVWFVPVDDDGEIVNVVNLLVSDDALRAALGQGAAEVADAFTWDKIAEKTAVFFQSLK